MTRLVSHDPAFNPARPPPGTVLCALSDVAEPGAKGFVFRQDEALFSGFILRRGGQTLGYVDSCPHAGWPLSGGPDRYLTRDGNHVLCAGHGALFTPETGLCTSGPCAGRSLNPWPVVVEGGMVVVK
ncbi:MAG: hypothetical protein RLZZ141_507 [Pseudomonadota bacterium]